MKNEIEQDGKNPACPACREYRLHTDEEWIAHHPYHGDEGSESK